MVKKYKIALLLVCTCFSVFSQETFKTMFYNVLNFPIQIPASRIQQLDIILNDYQPDLFMICELNNEDGANTILQSLQSFNANYQRAAFVNNTSDDGIGDQNELQQMLYYDSSKFILESQNEVTTTYRDFNHYKLKLNSIDQATNPVILDVFVTHLKSSDGTVNQNLRLAMVQEFVTYLNTLPSNSNVVLAGDLNLYRSTEPAFQELIDVTNNITFVDPANRIGNWHNDSSFLDVYTQSTRTQSGLGGATGGFDDRFDFIMTSDNMISNPNISYVSNSYKVYGNNNNPNCYNSEINSNDCSGIDYSQSIRDALYLFSDHLPVTLELQTNEALLNTNKVTTKDLYTIKGSNIVSTELRIFIDHAVLEVDELEIYNVLGKKVASFKVLDRNLTTLNVSYLANGMYFVVPKHTNVAPLKFIKK